MIGILLLTTAALAYDLGGHQDLSERTVALASADTPVVARYGEVLSSASVFEDLDLFTKWTRTSHYYDPLHLVANLRRMTSRERVQELGKALDSAIAHGDAADAWWYAGRLLHHVQDMASPPHVVPVAHDLSDGFESYETAELAAEARERRLPPMSGLQAHRRLALETRARVEQGGWESYWAPEPGRFGRYGVVGNRFGATDDPEVASLERAFAADRAAAAISYGEAFVRDTAERLAERDQVAGR